jgi:outer membrane protein OmpA-like peptidoglycan-associated protein
LITTWIAIAVYYYFPQYFPILGTPTPQENNPEALSMKKDPVESEKQSTLAKEIESPETVQERPTEAMTPENPIEVQPDSNDNPRQFQMPDPHVVIRIEFDGNNELSMNGIETLDNLSVVLHNHPQLEIAIKGYSESQGSYRYNKKMSEFTANIVKGYLVGKGVSPQRIESMGMWLIHSDPDAPAAKSPKNAQWVEIQFKNPS